MKIFASRSVQKELEMHDRDELDEILRLAMQAEDDYGHPEKVAEFDRELAASLGVPDWDDPESEEGERYIWDWLKRHSDR
jgi:hypothetical protein